MSIITKWNANSLLDLYSAYFIVYLSRSLYESLEFWMELNYLKTHLCYCFKYRLIITEITPILRKENHSKFLMLYM